MLSHIKCHLFSFVSGVNLCNLPDSTAWASAFFNTVQDLLSGQFNVTLGDKLSEHLKKWIDVTNVLQPPQPVRDNFMPCGLARRIGALLMSVF